MGEIILLMRRTFEASTRLHKGDWNKSSAGSHEVRGLTLGIVGYGKIGSQVSDLAEAMGMRVVFHDVAHVLARGNARAVSFRELLETADVITLHVDGKHAESESDLAKKKFTQMKDGACLINLSRGFVVDHEALARHLKSWQTGRRGGRCLSAGTGNRRRILQSAAGAAERDSDSACRRQHRRGAAEYRPVRFRQDDRLFPAAAIR